MTGFLPDAVQQELAASLRQTRRRKAKRVVHVGDEAVPILEMSEDGFAVAFEDAPNLRGLIDIHEGARHLYQALIVASERDGDLMRYEFKRNTATSSTPPRDFADEVSAPVLLPPPD
jgi:hypothetical protein